MKIGSIVECIKPYKGDIETKPVPKGIYIIREIILDADRKEGVTLEEIINIKVYGHYSDKNNIGYFEPVYDIERFREIEFPPSMEADIQEALTKETTKELIQTL